MENVRAGRSSDINLRAARAQTTLLNKTICDVANDVCGLAAEALHPKEPRDGLGNLIAHHTELVFNEVQDCTRDLFGWDRFNDSSNTIGRHPKVLEYYS